MIFADNYFVHSTKVMCISLIYCGVGANFSQLLLLERIYLMESCAG